MDDNIFNIGDRVVVLGFVDGRPLRNKCGTVVALKNPLNSRLVLGIEFDDPIPDGHDCGRRGLKGYCRWATKADLGSIKILPPIDDDEKEMLIGEEEAGIIDRFLSNFPVG